MSDRCNTRKFKLKMNVLFLQKESWTVQTARFLGNWGGRQAEVLHVSTEHGYDSLETSTLVIKRTEQAHFR